MSALPLSDGSARWFTPPSGQRPLLWCLPYAGGGASIFRAWERALAPWVEVRPVFLPGREARFGEPAVEDLASLADTLCQLTRPWAHLPQAWFGHSMGAALAYETVLRVQREPGRQPPRLLAVGGRAAPGLGRLKPPLHALPDAEFMAQLSRLGGTPQAVLDDAELMELLLPLLRADFKAIETWQASRGPLLHTDVLVLGGEDDPETTPERMAAWQQVCDPARLALQRLPGGHFFIHGSQDQVLAALGRQLQQSL